ncbi:MAG: EAL domain-containing protein [Myxococcales bacterium]|nr:EAL domain-containing protein [Myxococcales bacterium]
MRQDPLDEQLLHKVAGRWLAALSDGSKELVALFDPDGSLQFAGAPHTAEELLGYGPAELLRLLPAELVHPADAALVAEAFRAVCATPGARHTLSFRARHKAGRFVAVQATAVNRLGDPVVRAVVVFARAAASTVAGSEVGDRASFVEVLNGTVRRAQLRPAQGFAVLVIELERYRMLLGSYGAAVARGVTEEVTRRLLPLLRPQDRLAQLADNEFALLLDGTADHERAAELVERIQQAVSQRMQVGGKEITTAAIVGIATSERRYERAEEVLRDAGVALNRARSQGRRQRAVFRTQMRLEDAAYMALLAELNAALHNDEFRVHYQPVVSLTTRSLVGFEALVRWYHPTRGIVAPSEFIAVAEDTGLIQALGERVLTLACRQMAQWHRRHRGVPPPYVSVNLSAKQVVEERIGDTILRILGESELDPSKLCLELTESAVLESQEAAASMIARLRRHGVRLALDDFGTGYASFSYLQKLPYDALKIDRSFVRQLGDGQRRDDRAIVHAIVVLAHNLNMEVVAEGVETAEQAAVVHGLACEYAQGYAFARPLDALAAEALIVARHRF